MTYLSIVTTTYDNTRDRDGSLEVLRDILERQQLPYPTEWCLVDGGSDDATANVVSSLSGRKLSNGIRVQTESDNRYATRAAGRNRGVQLASGNVCLFLDDDTVPLSETCIDDAVNAWTKGSVACGARRYWSPPSWSTTEIREAILERDQHASEWAHLPVDSLNRRTGKPNLQEFSSISNFGIVSREKLLAVGGFDETFTNWGFEDRELLVRLLRHTGEFINLFDTTQILHFNHPLDVPSGAVASNRDRFTSALDRQGVTFDAGQLFDADAGTYSDILGSQSHHSGGSPVEIQVKKPGDLPSPSEPPRTPSRCAVFEPGAGFETEDVSDNSIAELAVSVIISTANSFRDRNGSLSLVLRSLEAQRGANFEVVVVDDGSTDRTAEFLASFDGSSALDVRHVRFEENTGNRARARNTGADVATGDALLFIDDDTIPLSNRAIETLCRLYRPNSFLCGAQRYWTDTEWDRAELAEAIDDRAYDDLRSQCRLPRGLSRRHGERSLWEFTHLTNFGLVDADAFEAVNGFDAVNFDQWGREDIDLMLRLLLNGSTFIRLYDCVPVAHLNHPLKTPDRQSRERAYERYVAKTKEYGYRLDLNRLYGASDEAGGDVLVTVD